MLEYPIKAKTVKTLNRFTYNMYLDISANMLKYNNDSSAALRLLSAFVDTSQDTLEDLNYIPTFNMSGLDFTTIDRFNGYVIEKIPNITPKIINNATYIDKIKGYCKYTDASYDLEYIPDLKDFVRHSLPCDVFFGEELIAEGYRTVLLPPNEKVQLDVSVEKSAITIRPYSGFSSTSMYNRKSLSVTVYGISTTGVEIEETIEINSMVDFVTQNEYQFITGAMAVGSAVSVGIILFPYIVGDYAMWDNDIVDRETGDVHSCLISVDQEAKTLNFNTLSNYDVSFPMTVDPYKIVKLDMPDSNEIWNQYIDVHNKLLYVLCSSHKLHCFPLMIPTSYNNTLDINKTDYQSIRVEYVNDSVNELVTFYVFPSYKTIDVETMSILVNGVEYKSHMLLDLIRENIETNRIEIPYSVLFDGRENCIVEFRTYGLDECVLPIYVEDTKLKPLYVKDLLTVPAFGADLVGWIGTAVTTNNIPYKQYLSGNIGIDYNAILMKLSSCGNILVNGYRIVNVFNTFSYDDESLIITSDTITSVQGSL